MPAASLRIPSRQGRMVEATNARPEAQPCSSKKCDAPSSSSPHSRPALSHRYTRSAHRPAHACAESSTPTASPRCAFQPSTTAAFATPSYAPAFARSDHSPETCDNSTNPLPATQCRARNQCPRSIPAAASESTFPVSTTVAPNCSCNTSGKSLLPVDRTSPRSAPHSAAHKIHAPVSSPSRSPPPINPAASPDLSSAPFPY